MCKSLALDRELAFLLFLILKYEKKYLYLAYELIVGAVHTQIYYICSRKRRRDNNWLMSSRSTWRYMHASWILVRRPIGGVGEGQSWRYDLFCDSTRPGVRSVTPLRRLSRANDETEQNGRPGQGHPHAHDAWHETLATNSLTWDLGARAERMPATRTASAWTICVVVRTPTNN